MRFSFACSVFVSMAAVAFAQQDPQFSQNLDYNAFINPSFMVNDYQLNADVQHRQQWVGFAGRPISTTANASYEVKKAHSAFGVTYVHSQLGAQENHTARLNYAGAIRLKGGHTIVPSIYLGAIVHSLDGSQFNPVQSGDANIISSKQSAACFDLGLGISYGFRGLLVAFSTSHLTSPTMEFNDGNASSEITVARHYCGLVRYDIHAGRVFRIKPLSFVKTDAASAQFDNWVFLGADNLTKVLTRVNIGVGYRVQDAVIVSAELIFKWFRLGYSYDITTSGLSAFSNGSHEATLRMHLFPNPPYTGGRKASKELE